MKDFPELDWNYIIDGYSFGLDKDEENKLKEQMKDKLQQYLKRIQKNKISIIS